MGELTRQKTIECEPGCDQSRSPTYLEVISKPQKAQQIRFSKRVLGWLLIKVVEGRCQILSQFITVSLIFRVYGWPMIAQVTEPRWFFCMAVCLIAECGIVSSCFFRATIRPFDMICGAPARVKRRLPPSRIPI